MNKNQNKENTNHIPGNDAKFDIVVVDAIKLPLLNFSNFSIAKLVVNKLVRVKITLSRLSLNTKLISNN